MDDVSKLLQEAKPLYFARKRRNRQIKYTLCTLVLLAGIGSFNFTAPTTSYSEEFWPLGWEQQISSTEPASIIEEMGLPVDDFGLLMIG